MAAIIVAVGAALALAAGLAAQTDDSCARTLDCQSHGRCSSLLGFCVVGSDLDCAFSDPCKKRGLCRVQAGTCVSGSLPVGR